LLATHSRIYLLIIFHASTSSCSCTFTTLLLRSLDFLPLCPTSSHRPPSTPFPFTDTLFCCTIVQSQNLLHTACFPTSHLGLRVASLKAFFLARACTQPLDSIESTQPPPPTTNTCLASLASAFHRLIDHLTTFSRRERKKGALPSTNGHNDKVANGSRRFTHRAAPRYSHCKPPKSNCSTVYLISVSLDLSVYGLSYESLCRRRLGLCHPSEQASRTDTSYSNRDSLALSPFVHQVLGYWSLDSLPHARVSYAP
jgi:hypothetical protein